MRHQLKPAIGNRRSALPRGFTLVEMLTVIGIIILLVSILLPVVGSVRQKAHAADTAAQLQSIAAGIQRYRADFGAYPGPIHNGHIYGGTGVTPALSITVKPQPGQTPPPLNTAKITQSENLVLGLLGGLIMETSGLKYDSSLIGNGPLSLNAANPKKYQAYMDKTNLSEGDYKDDAGDADDSSIPEFLDRFPDGMPVLYLRAKVGAGSASGSGTTSVPLVTNQTAYAQQGQYDVRQILAYTDRLIGVGKEFPANNEYAVVPPPPNPESRKHGLRTARTNATIQTPAPSGLQYVYPYDLYGYLRHPSMPNTARNSDGFILISAGIDRIYGTRDDIQQPPFR